MARTVVYHARTAALVFAGVVAAGVALAMLSPPKYRSEARLLALPSDYYAVRGRDRNAAGAAEAFKPEQLANVEMQLLSSEDIQREALRRSGGPSDSEALDKALKGFAKNLSIQQVENANVIELTYKSGDAQESARRLQTLLDVYFETRAKVLTSGQSSLVAKQRDEAGKELEAANTALRSFQEANGIADIDGQVSGAIAVDTALRQDLASTRADLSQTQGNASRLRGAHVAQTVELYRDDTEATRAVAEMQGQILALEAKKADLQGRYMQGSPLIEQTDKQIAGLRSAIDKQSGELREARRMGRNTYYDAARDRVLQTDAAASGQSAKLGRLGQEISASEGRLRNLNEVAGAVARLKTQRDVAEERYRNLTTQLDDARTRELEAGTGSTNVRVIQRPSVPDGNANSPVMLIAGSVLAGLVLAGATLMVLVATRGNFLSRSEVTEALALPVLVDLTGTRPRAVRARNSLAKPPAQRGGVIALVAAEAAAYDAELTALVRQLEAKSGSSVATVTFEESAYGLEHGQLARLLPDPTGHGRIKVGSTAWGIDRTGERLLESMRQRFRWTLLLVPPVSAATVEETREARGLDAAGLADQVLLVVRTEVTRKAAVQRLLGALREAGVSVAGVMLTGRRLTWPGFVRRLG